MRGKNKGFGPEIAIIACAVLLSGCSRVNTLSQVEPFRILVVGDSVAWGQGLLPQHKFTTLVANALATELNHRPVDISDNFSHSGATIGLGDDAAMTPYGSEKPGFASGEIPSAYPTIWNQVEKAVATAASMTSASSTL
jgi:hypothetical protein